MKGWAWSDPGHGKRASCVPVLPLNRIGNGDAGAPFHSTLLTHFALATHPHPQAAMRLSLLGTALVLATLWSSSTAQVSLGGQKKRDEGKGERRGGGRSQSNVDWLPWADAAGSTHAGTSLFPRHHNRCTRSQRGQLVENMPGGGGTAAGGCHVVIQRPGLNPRLPPT